MAFLGWRVNGKLQKEPPDWFPVKLEQVLKSVFADQSLELSTKGKPITPHNQGRGEPPLAERV